MFLGEVWMAHHHRHLCWHPYVNSEPVGGIWGRWFTLRWTSYTRLDRKETGNRHRHPPRHHCWTFFFFIPHLVVAFCDFLLFWPPLVLLGSRIHFCKARKLGFLSYHFSWHFFGQLLRSAWCVWALDEETLVPKVHRLCETTFVTLQWNCANVKVSHIVSYGVSWGGSYPSWLQEVSLPLRKRICLAAKFQLDETRWRPYMSRPLVLQEVEASRISRRTRHVN
jgi:hypothetical protein